MRNLATLFLFSEDAPLMENMYKEEYAGEVMDIEDLTNAGRKFK